MPRHHRSLHQREIPDGGWAISGASRLAAPSMDAPRPARAFSTRRLEKSAAAIYSASGCSPKTAGLDEIRGSTPDHSLELNCSMLQTGFADPGPTYAAIMLSIALAPEGELGLHVLRWRRLPCRRRRPGDRRKSSARSPGADAWSERPCLARPHREPGTPTWPDAGARCGGRPSHNGDKHPFIGGRRQHKTPRRLGIATVPKATLIWRVHR